MKTGKVSKADKEFIVKNQKRGAEYLAKKIDRSVESVNKVLAELVAEEEKNKPIIATEYVHNIKTREMFGRAKTAIVMTQGLSEVMDEVSKKRSKKGRYDSCIQKIIQD